MKKNTNNIGFESKDKIVFALKTKHDKVVDELSNNIYMKRAYVNLPLNLLERTFFNLCAKKIFHKDQTKLLRSLIHRLMDRYPDIVEEAKQQIMNGDIHDNK